MVVLSAAIVSKSKTIFARQFVDVPRMKIEALLSAFGKIVDNHRRDYTFVETDSLRYVFQPMEQLYLVLLTSKHSNILEDLDTLKLLYKILQDVCHNNAHDEKIVLDNVFDIIFAFDEVVSFGHRESVTASQVKTYTEMDSHEERLHDMLEQSKINEAKEVSKRKQIELAKTRAQALKDGKVISDHGVDIPSADSTPPAQIRREPMSNLPPFRPPLSTSAASSSTAIPQWTPGMNEASQEISRGLGTSRKGMSLGGKRKPPQAIGSMNL